MELKLQKPREKWFFLIALPVAVAIEWAFARSLDWTAYPRSEWVALFDLCVFMPAIYLAAFRSELTPKARMLRTLGVAGIGLFASRWIVPEPNQFIIGELSALRNVTMIGVLAFEGWIFWKVIGAVYRRGADAKTLEREFAIPELIARLMVLEAKFWKAVWAFLRRK
ncbi:hypothetical protein [Porphyrobacter sp. AAP60]|uniref:hypothetical protein n=1 Tax=Porphyrobacter sp. AAP60 TaxID=1523423 RepID=UPI0006B8FA2D|nr:hypothetical protein [Porphyrobacter sp. AAP60]KPF61740.1 hypothetical protein IP79_14860 [Porphyrobacter sp. AAP60]